MKGSDPVRLKSLPAVLLAKRLESERYRIPRESFGTPVVPGLFDSCLSVIVVPDHLLSGLIKCWFTDLFTSPTTDEERSSLEGNVIYATNTNGLPTHRSLLKWDTAGRFKVIHSMRI